MLLVPNSQFQQRFGLRAIDLVDQNNCVISFDGAEKGNRALCAHVKATIINSNIETPKNSPKKIKIKLNVEATSNGVELTLRGDLLEILKCLDAASLTDENEIHKAQSAFSRKCRPY